MRQLDNSIFQLGEVRIDPALDEIRKDGAIIKLEPRTMRLLVCLAERPGQVVSVDELLNLVWKDVVVSPDSVYSAVASLRRTLGDDPKDPTYIANVMRRGYRLVAPVSTWVDTLAPQPTMKPPVNRRPDLLPPIEGSPESQAQQPPPPASEPARTRQPRRLVAAILGVAALATALGYFVAEQFRRSERTNTTRHQTTPPPVISDASVAVLPFLDLSERKDQEYLADGMSEELIDSLSQVPELHVPARTSSFYFKGKQVTIADIAKALGVGHVLEGSIRKSGNNLRITAQLIRADTGYHLWSASYDRKLDDIFAIQKEIAAAVRQALSVSLLNRQTAKAVGTQDLEAYDLFLRARSLYFHSGRREDWATIFAYLEQALHRDERFASAWALLAGAQLKLGDFDNPVEERHQLEEDARRSARQALALDKMLPEAHIAMAYVLLLDMNWDGAQKEIQEALALDPSNSSSIRYMGTTTAITGQLDRSLALLEKSIASDPFNPHAYSDLGLVRYSGGMYSAAQIAFRKCLDLNPQEQEIHWSIGANLLLSSRAADALAEFDLENGERLRLQGRALALHALGRKAEADAALGSLENKYGDRAPYAIAQVRAFRNEADQAIAALERAYTIRDGSIWTIKIDPLFNNIRTDQRFMALLRRMQLIE
jgi:TolB-like protein/DNA-binding winged helix-turn-helix (wHTH) protein/Tfp pilus assembly protein PilF